MPDIKAYRTRFLSTQNHKNCLLAMARDLTMDSMANKKVRSYDHLVVHDCNRVSGSTSSCGFLSNRDKMLRVDFQLAEYHLHACVGQQQD